MSSVHSAVSHSPSRRSDFQKKPSNDKPAEETMKPEAKNGAAPTDEKPPAADEKKKRKKYCFVC
jgi:hypothetical protein